MGPYVASNCIYISLFIEKICNVFTYIAVTIQHYTVGYDQPCCDITFVRE